jgi:hypothetical protein
VIDCIKLINTFLYLFEVDTNHEAQHNLLRKDEDDEGSQRFWQAQKLDEGEIP